MYSKPIISQYYGYAFLIIIIIIITSKDHMGIRLPSQWIEEKKITKKNKSVDVWFR